MNNDEGPVIGETNKLQMPDTFAAVNDGGRTNPVYGLRSAAGQKNR